MKNSAVTALFFLFVIAILLLFGCAPCTIWRARESANDFARTQYDGFVNSCSRSPKFLSSNDEPVYECVASWTDAGPQHTSVYVDSRTCQAWTQ